MWMWMWESDAADFLLCFALGALMRSCVHHVVVFHGRKPCAVPMAFEED